MNWKKKHTFIVLRILVIIVPVILSSIFLFSPFEKIDITREHNTINETTIKISSDTIFEPNLKNNIRDTLQVPFNLKWYDICFENKGTKNIYGDNRSEDYNVNVSVNFNNNETIIQVPTFETNCIKYQLDKDFTYAWQFRSHLNISEAIKQEPKKEFINETHYLLLRGEGKIYYDTNTFVKPEINSIIVKNILVLISWSGLIWLFTRIRKFILKGFDA